jgi:membrane-associated protease RseP (regulator of RpoE activity)
VDFPHYPPPVVPEAKGHNLKLHLFLFLATLATTVTAGALLDGADIFSQPRLIYRGIPFAVSLMLILGIHETAHYLASRRWGLKVTLPFFIPAPTIIGTMGALIKIKSPISHRKALLDIGVSGPLAGFLAALPVAVIGLKLSRVGEVVGEGEGVSLGASLLFGLLVDVFVPGQGEGLQVMLHPVAFAAWIGFFVTALNLLPIGQLDGGHIICALFGKYHSHLSLMSLAILIPLGRLWPGWLFWAAVLVFIIGWRHPPPLNMQQPLDGRRRLLAFLSILVFVLTFTPVPFSLP